MKYLFVLLVLCAALVRPANAADAKTGFSSETVDLGMVVSDLEASVKFYTEAIGFKEVPGFTVPASWTKDVGLTDGKDLKIRVFALGEGKTATKLKLMQPEDTPRLKKKARKQLIAAQLGFRYLTIAVTDMDAALARLEKAGVKPDTKDGMVVLPEGFPQNLYLLLVRDPDGNMVELVGPRKSAKK